MDYQRTVDIIRAALDNYPPRSDYAKQAAERWLMAQPGHLTISVLLADALLTGGESVEAGRILNQVLLVDPENAQALALLVRLSEQGGDSATSWAAAAALSRVEPKHPIARIKLARMAVNGKDSRIPTPKTNTGAGYLALIPALIELEKLWKEGDSTKAGELAVDLIKSNSRLAKAHLILGDCLMARGKEAQAVECIHQSASLDPGAEIAHRIWADQQPYNGAWPAPNVSDALGPIPHEIAVALGINLLPAPVTTGNGNGKNGSTNYYTGHPGPGAPVPPISPAAEALIDIQAEINRLNGRSTLKDVISEPAGESEQPVRLNPIYVLATSMQRLQEKYGVDGWQQIDTALQALAKAAEARLAAPAGVIYVDDSASLDSFGLEPVDPADPWAVKTLFQQLDTRLEEKDMEIGWLLLIGGADIIAHHRLPNPTEDNDTEVLSDNPYGCKDENYFVPHRAVGRFPDGAGDDPTLLLKCISTALSAHNTERRAQKGFIRNLWDRLLWLFRGRQHIKYESFGYSASVWRKASLEVFTQIGSARRLRISPPVTATEFKSMALGPSKYGYFNLHGITDGPAWYGQRDPTFPSDYPNFPIALRPEDVNAFGGSPKVILTEACYGALVQGKTSDTAMALKFLAGGSHMVIGSTCIAYGGLTASLEGADLLAYYFWREIMAGRSGGRALQQAKVAFARRLDERQGYLDAEDQKTLISFVYYGDPSLAAPPASQAARSKKWINTWKDLTECPPTICSTKSARQSPDQVPQDLVDQVRMRVSRYLPGMERADMVVSRQRVCRGQRCERLCADCQVDARHQAKVTDKMVFTMKKEAKEAGARHQQVVQVTVDQAGQVLKLAVSK
ncbi:MAG: hypothetical protein JXA42_01300 [Anaerolineales bacterium]|nr:hypothetical protein [Anaerolineales bacterium]